MLVVAKVVENVCNSNVTRIFRYPFCYGELINLFMLFCSLSNLTIHYLTTHQKTTVVIRIENLCLDPVSGALTYDVTTARSLYSSCNGAKTPNLLSSGRMMSQLLFWWCHKPFHSYFLFAWLRYDIISRSIDLRYFEIEISETFREGFESRIED